MTFTCLSIRFNHSIEEHVLEIVRMVRDLGIILDEKLTFFDQVNVIASKAVTVLGFLRQKDFHTPSSVRDQYVLQFSSFKS